MFEQSFIIIYGAAVRPDGAPSGAMRDRVGAAVRFGRRLLPQPIYIVTGGQGRYGPPEAEVMAQLLLERGIHPDYIVLEPTGTNTVRSTLAVASLLHGVPGPVYAATSAYHMPRCVVLLGLAGLDAHRSPPSIGPASSKLMRRWYWRMREVPAIPIDSLVMLWHRWRGIKPAEDPGEADESYGEEPAGELPENVGVEDFVNQKVIPMSVFGSIMSKIFGHKTEAATAPATPASSSAFDGPDAASAPAASAGAPAQSVDVGAVLTDMAAKSGQPSNWRTSIVDLMKLLGLDSSLDNRKSLAGELGYTGDTNDSATMNVWLHKQVMAKLAENGGIVPADLKG